MNWYYVESGRRMGPVSESTLAALVRAGAVTAKTLVWREGMAEWQPYEAARKVVFAPRPALVPRQEAAAGPAPGELETAAPGLGACSLCGRILPRDRFAGALDSDVCADCRRAFVRTSPDGIALPRVVVYGGFWRRFAAKIIDSLILSIPAVVVNFAAAPLLSPGGDRPLLAVGAQIIVLLINTAIGAVFTGLFLGTYGATPGKMALGLMVVTPDGGPIGYARGFGRYFAEMLSGLTLGIGYLMAAFDDQRRTLHDRICGTRVVRT